MQAEEQLAGRYELVELIGRGGMGEVWKALDLDTQRLVAVKLMRSEGEDDEAVARFRREAVIGGRVSHPGVVTVHDAGQDAGQLYIVMELLEGADLSAALATMPSGLPLDEAVDLALQSAEVLAAAHDHGIVHRDLKPANLFRQHDGRVRICDFGIARTADSTSGLTVTGRPFGTPAYMAPEQWRGAHVDFRCDLYALGCVLYALLVGTPPFNGDYYVLMRRHCEETPAPLHSLRPDLPFELVRLVAALLEKHPARRPRSARDVAAVLARVRDLPGGVLPVARGGDGRPVEGPVVAWLLARLRTSTDCFELAQAAELAALVSPALALELVETAEARLWDELPRPGWFMMGLSQLVACLWALAPRRVASLLAAAEHHLGHDGDAMSQLVGHLARTDNLARAVALARRLPPGKHADSAWVSLTISARDPALALSHLDHITDPRKRDQALGHAAVTVSDSDINEAMRILSRITMRAVHIESLARLAEHLALRHRDLTAARHLIHQAHEELASYLAAHDSSRDFDAATLPSILRSAQDRVETGVNRPRSPHRSPIDGMTARRRGSAIPDGPHGHHQLLELAREYIGIYSPPPLGIELLDLVSPRAPLPPEPANASSP
ncbi:serine/threonine-protein kinase [Streptomyces sp. NPDC015130]|uniref:serine/threonine-protein kinase n=1 Tax=Streptomyces sp. NPDC015130 TaxID=3364940 RepID=UPI003700D498